jgi:S-adenosylmethionine decarboxylase proenzyme
LETTSHHFLIELRSVNHALLDDLSKIETIFLESLNNSGATYINHFFHQFSPQGVSGVVVIAESHLSIHTWPEDGYAALDVFTCGNKEIGDKVVQNLVRSFQTDDYSIMYVMRGVDYKSLMKP